MSTKAFHPQLLAGSPDIQGESDSRAAQPLSNGIFTTRMMVGAIGGLLGTFVMALFGVGIFLIMGGPASLAFSFIGDAAAGFLHMLGIELTGGVSLGVVVYCLIGLALGILFVVAVSGIEMLRVDSTKKGVGLGILSVEIISQPMLAAAAIILKLTPSEMAQWGSVSFIMHLVYGGVLGAIVSHGLRAATAPRHA